MCVGDVGCVYVPAYFLVIQEITKLVLLYTLPPYLSLYKGEKHRPQSCTYGLPMFPTLSQTKQTWFYPGDFNVFLPVLELISGASIHVEGVHTQTESSCGWGFGYLNFTVSPVGVSPASLPLGEVPGRSEWAVSLAVPLSDTGHWNSGSTRIVLFKTDLQRPVDINSCWRERVPIQRRAALSNSHLTDPHKILMKFYREDVFSSSQHKQTNKHPVVF